MGVAVVFTSLALEPRPLPLLSCTAPKCRASTGISCLRHHGNSHLQATAHRDVSGGECAIVRLDRRVKTAFPARPHTGTRRRAGGVSAGPTSHPRPGYARGLSSRESERKATESAARDLLFRTSREAPPGDIVSACPGGGGGIPLGSTATVQPPSGIKLPETVKRAAPGMSTCSAFRQSSSRG